MRAKIGFAFVTTFLLAGSAVAQQNERVSADPVAPPPLNAQAVPLSELEAKRGPTVVTYFDP